MRTPVFKSKLSVIGLIVSIVAYATTRSSGESSTCLTVYKEGGAPAVFQSPKCPRWKLPNYDSRSRTTRRCQSAMLMGRRKSQEDRTLCALDLHIPFPGQTTLSLSLSVHIYTCVYIIMFQYVCAMNWCCSLSFDVMNCDTI